MLGYELTYVIWMFCRIVTSNYFNRDVSLGILICAFFCGTNSCSGCRNAEKALLESLERERRTMRCEWDRSHLCRDVKLLKERFIFKYLSVVIVS